MKTKFAILFRLVAAGILLQTLYFKFSGAPESKFIFATLGVEPYGRYFAGVSELVTSILLLIPVTQILGALMGIGIMVGAILSHLFILGISIQDDGGLLFSLAVGVLFSCLMVILLQSEAVKKNLSFARDLLRKKDK